MSSMDSAHVHDLSFFLPAEALPVALVRARCGSEAAAALNKLLEICARIKLQCNRKVRVHAVQHDKH